METEWDEVLVKCSSCCFVCRYSTHQKDTEMREVITAAACLRRRNTVGFAAFAVPATLTIWQREMKRHICRLLASCATMADLFTSSLESNKSLNSDVHQQWCTSEIQSPTHCFAENPRTRSALYLFPTKPRQMLRFGGQKTQIFLR